MQLKILAFCLSFFTLTLPVFAGKLITYTATSKQSQEEANNAAIAGVAKQVSAQVKVNQTLNKKEVSVKNESVLTENYTASSNVFSDVKIKGITVKPVPAEKGFKATATLDLDEFTSDIRFKLKSIQIEISKLEEATRTFLKNKQYKQAIDAIENAKELPPKYKALLLELGKVYPIGDSLRLKESISDLESQTVAQLSEIKIEGQSLQTELKNSEMKMHANVFDKSGAVGNFPLAAKQGRKILAELQTQEDGSADFTLRGIDISRGPFVIVVEPNLPENFLDAAGLRKKLEIDFKVAQSRCTVNIQCSKNADICAALEKNLAKKAIFNDTAAVPKINFDITAKAGKPIEYIPGKFTTPYDISISLKGDEISFIATGHANGKQESEAVKTVIKKMDFSPLKKQLEKFCK